MDTSHADVEENANQVNTDKHYSMRDPMSSEELQTGEDGRRVNLEPVLQALGTKGCYQMLQLTLQILGSFVVSIPAMGFVFIGYQPPFQCQEVQNMSQLEPYLRDLQPNMTAMSVQYSQCSIEVTVNYSDTNTLQTLPCVAGINFSMPVDTSFLTEWSLVCEQSGLTEVSQALTMVGMTVGSLLFSALADRYGRKKIYVLSILSLLVISCGTSLVLNYYMLLVCRFLSGFLSVGIEMSAYTMFMELLPHKWRCVTSVADALMYSVSCVAMATVAYLLQGVSWRYLNLAFSASYLFGLLLPWLLDESLLWLITKGRMKEVETILRKACRMNGKNYEVVNGILKDNIHVRAVTIQLEVTRVTETETSLTPVSEDYPENHDQSEPLVNDGWKPVIKDSENDVTSRSRALPFDVHRNMQDDNDDVNINGIAENGCTSELPKFQTQNNPHRHTEDDLHEADDGQVQAMFQREQRPAEEKDDTGHYSPLDLFRHRVLSLYLFVVTLVYVSDCLYFYGVIFGSAKLYGNRFLNFGILTVLDIPAVTLALFLMPRFGRKTLGFWFGHISGIALLLSVSLTQLVPNATGLTVARVAQYVGKFSLMGAGSLLFVYTLEIFPTSLRSTSFGVASAVANTASIAAPFFVLLGEYIPWAPGVIMGSLMIIATLTIHFIPETSHRKLPDTITEIKSWRRKSPPIGMDLAKRSSC